MQLILPKTAPHSLPPELPLFFLAGPIKGGGDWQLEMTRRLVKRVDSECIIVNPSRYTPDHPLYQYRVAGRENYWQRQTDWERYYLRLAAERWETGCIIFWLPTESKTNPRTGPEPYAMDTRGEIGEWRGHLMHNKDLRVAMGAEDEFPGLNTIRRNFEMSLGSRFKIHSTMEEVVDQVIEFLLRDIRDIGH